MMAACGGGGGGGQTPPPISVTISPTSATVGVGETSQFTATVSNGGSNSVSWQVNGVAGGSASAGTISTSGLYTAPAVAPSPNSVTVTAVAVADQDKRASATVTIQGKTGVVVSPTSASVAVGTTQQFTAAINGQTSTAVNWQVNGIPDGNATVGTIDSQGLYTAPAVLPNPAAVTITAISQADSSQKATANLTITQFSNASLKGSFAFVMTGIDANGIFQQGGVLKADGSGYITAGTADYMQGNTTLLAKSISGTYSIDPNTGVGTASLATAVGPFDLTFVMSGADYAYFIESDDWGNASGSMQRQDPTAFSTSAISGNYAFMLSGAHVSGAFNNPTAMAGMFVANGGTISSGLEDINDGSSFTPTLALTGSYTIGGNGRGTGQLVTAKGTTNVAFYVVDKNKVRLFSTDPTNPLTGTAEKQTGTFTNAGFSGNYVVSSSGSFVTNGYVPVNTLALYTANGNGTGSGAMDQMLNQSAGLQMPFSATYTVDASGRLFTTLTYTEGLSTQVAWFVNPQRAFVLFADNGRVETGVLEQQAGTALSTSSVEGAYGFGNNGIDYTDVVEGEYVDTVGRLTADGNGGLSMYAAENRSGSNGTASRPGSYNVDAKGRGMTLLNDGTSFVFYVVDGSKLYMLRTDRFTQMAGSARKQY